MGTVVSVNVGLPRDVQWRGRIVRTAIWKTPVAGRVFARRLNLDGDGQADLSGHGGEQRALMVYQMDSYRYWERVLGRSDFVHGQFGENLTVEGLSDSEVCIGDRYRIGGAVFEISQPRVTCYRLGIRMDHPQMPAMVVAHRRPGFYFRVIQEGSIGAGDTIEKLVTGPERMTVAEIDALLYTSDHPVADLHRAMKIAALSPGWRWSINALLDAAEKGGVGNAGLAPSTASEPLWQGFRSLEVTALKRESDDVRSIEFASSDGTALPAPLPGQHLVVKLVIDGRKVLRNYSLIGGAPGRFRIAVKREPRGIASTFIHDRLRTADKIDVSAPRGTFVMADGTAPVVFVSGGIGITPVLAMLRSMESSPDRSVFWFHVARDASHHPFANEVRELLAKLPHGNGCVAYSRPADDLRLGIDYDVKGRLGVDVLQTHGVPSTAEFYLCGPAGFMQDIGAGLKRWGVAPKQIHSEAFNAGPTSADTRAVPPHLPATRGSGPKVNFTRSGITAQWDLSYGSLLELAEACSVPVRWSCRTGVCHNCESGLIEGRLRYQPEPIDPPPEGRALICCAMPLSEVSLDL
ncbi:MOSC and FAD-binding oxidoreductase domain-containing protein [Bradyrhizobium canariense]|uniref:Ferredoxin-NADP reductase n=1 Tax=Bradyrhizobium canariense TaxID=255045 RepID=A0A1H2B8X6_9BRAD|nr:MOSC and FAD-binding oxidoreductase domain-containing protein [Bradyrhizobium canariense]SDT54740.1 Ferredoxin-NADP reductase [Bradyrhizobium canariense]